jgi:hypothetical protein
LRSENENLLEQAKVANELQNNYDKATGLRNRMKLGWTLNKMRNALSEKFYRMEQTMSIFKQEDDLTKSNPLLFGFWLFAGIFLLLISFGMIAHTVFHIIPKDGVHGLPLNSFFDGIISNSSTFMAFAVGAFLFTALCCYLQVAIMKGNNAVHLIFPDCLWGQMPFLYNGTWLSSFLVNSAF